MLGSPQAREGASRRRDALTVDMQYGGLLRVEGPEPAGDVEVVIRIAAAPGSRTGADRGGPSSTWKKLPILIASKLGGTGKQKPSALQYLL